MPEVEHARREFVALAGELGLAWPRGQRPHPVIGFSDVQPTEQALADTTPTAAAPCGFATGVVAAPTRRRGW